MATELATTNPTRQSSLRIRVEGRPAPKGSRNYGRSKAGVAYTWPASKHEKPWVEAVRDATREAVRRSDPIPPPYLVDIEIIIARGRQTTYAWPSQNDVDKLARAVVDGPVFGKAMTDDRHVIELRARKRFARSDEPPGAVAIVTGLDS
jgi:Holliday junction resolvase RusA-like endonuclease